MHRKGGISQEIWNTGAFSDFSRTAECVLCSDYDVKTKILLVKSVPHRLERRVLRSKSDSSPQPVSAEAVVWGAGRQIQF